ncbi:MAG: hypothetical protein ACRDV4_05215 [Acidimicrobiales bacterium]
MKAVTVAALVSLQVAALATLSGCSSQYSGSTVAQQVQSWATTSPDPKFSSAVATLREDLGHTSQAESMRDSGLVRTVCDVLVTDALSANQNLPTPDARPTGELSGAYAAAVSAGQDCYCAAGGHPCPRGTSSKAALLQKASRASSAAMRGFVEAQARVDMFLLEARGT